MGGCAWSGLVAGAMAEVNGSANFPSAVLLRETIFFGLLRQFVFISERNLALLADNSWLHGQKAGCWVSLGPLKAWVIVIASVVT